jgi:signal peptidase I
MATFAKTYAALLMVVLCGCSSFHGFSFRVPTESMEPTVNPGDSVFADLFYYAIACFSRSFCQSKLTLPRDRVNFDVGVFFF